jgi:hypothetical protein
MRVSDRFRSPSPSYRRGRVDPHAGSGLEQWQFAVATRDVVHSSWCETCSAYQTHRSRTLGTESANHAEHERGAFYARGLGTVSTDQLREQLKEERDRADVLYRRLRDAEYRIRDLERGQRHPTSPKSLGQRLEPPVSLEDRISIVDAVCHDIPEERETHPEIGEIPQSTKAELAPSQGYFRGREMYDGTNVFRMDKAWQHRAQQNVDLGLPVPLGSMSVFAGRGPRSSDPQTMEQVAEMMDRIVREKSKAPRGLINEAAEFIDRISELRLSEGDHEPHHQEAMRRWSDMPDTIKNWKSTTMRKHATLRNNRIVVPTAGLNDSPSQWRLYIMDNPISRPMGVRLTTRGYPHLPDLATYISIARLSFPRERKREDRKALGARNSAFFRAVIYILAQEGFYAAKVTERNVPIAPTRTRNHFNGQFDDQQEVAIDEVVDHLAANGLPITWTESPYTTDYALAYLREWERRTDSKIARNSRLYRVFDANYPSGRPVVDLVDPIAKETPNVERVGSPEHNHIDEDAPIPDDITPNVLEALELTETTDILAIPEREREYPDDAMDSSMEEYIPGNDGDDALMY